MEDHFLNNAQMTGAMSQRNTEDVNEPRRRITLACLRCRNRYVEHFFSGSSAATERGTLRVAKSSYPRFPCLYTAKFAATGQTSVPSARQLVWLAITFQSQGGLVGPSVEKCGPLRFRAWTHAPSLPPPSSSTYREENQAARDKKAMSKLVRAKAAGSSGASRTPSPVMGRDDPNTATLRSSSSVKSLKRKVVPSTPQPPRLNRRHTEPFKAAQQQTKLSLNTLPAFAEMETSYIPPSPPSWSSSMVGSGYACEMSDDMYFSESFVPAPSYYSVQDGTPFIQSDEEYMMQTPSPVFTTSCQPTPMQATPKYCNYDGSTFEYPSPPQSLPSTSPVSVLAYPLPDYTAAPQLELEPGFSSMPSISRSQSTPYLKQQLSSQQYSQAAPSDGQPVYTVASYSVESTHEQFASPRPLFPKSQSAGLVPYPYPSSSGAQRPTGLCLFIDSTQQMSLESEGQSQYEPMYTSSTPSLPTSPTEPSSSFPSGPIDWNSRPLRPFPSVMMPVPGASPQSGAPFVLSAPPKNPPAPRNHSLRPSLSMNALGSSRQTRFVRPTQPSHFPQDQARPASLFYPADTVRMDEVCSSGL